jgi:hypothetical protein
VRDTAHAVNTRGEWIAPRAPFVIQTTPELVQAVRLAFLQRHATGQFRGIVHACFEAGETADFITWRVTTADTADGAAASVFNGAQSDRLTVKVQCVAGRRLGVDATKIDFLTGRLQTQTSNNTPLLVANNDGSVSRDATTGSLQIKPTNNGTAISTGSILFPNGTIMNSGAQNDNAKVTPTPSQATVPSATPLHKSNDKATAPVEQSTNGGSNSAQPSSSTVTVTLTTWLIFLGVMLL